jgi:hypothetical protein
MSSGRRRRLLVTPPSGSGGLMNGTDVIPVEERLYTIRQQVVSHSRLLELAESTGLYQDWRKSHPTAMSPIACAVT